jgi:hypothetical protein
MMMPDFALPPQEWTTEMWREAIKAVVQFSAQKDEEYPDDFVTAGWILGQKRAELRGEGFWPGVHPQYPLMVLTRWPWKVAYSPEVRKKIVDKRSGLVNGIHGIVATGHIQELKYEIPYSNDQVKRLMNVIPDNILVLPIDDLYQRIAKDGGREVTDQLRW